MGIETESVLGCFEQHRRNRYERSEEDRCLHSAWSVPNQDPHQASHKGRSEEHIRQRGEGGGEASKDHRQGLPSGSIEEADLEWSFIFLDAMSEVASCGNPTGQTRKAEF